LSYRYEVTLKRRNVYIGYTAGFACVCSRVSLANWIAIGNEISPTSRVGPLMRVHGEWFRQNAILQKFLFSTYRFAMFTTGAMRIVTYRTEETADFVSTLFYNRLKSEKLYIISNWKTYKKKKISYTSVEAEFGSRSNLGFSILLSRIGFRFIFYLHAFYKFRCRFDKLFLVDNKTNANVWIRGVDDDSTNSEEVTPMYLIKKYRENTVEKKGDNE